MTIEPAQSLGDLDVDALRGALEDGSYTVDAVIDRLGVPGQAGLGRNSTIPALDALGDDLDPQATMIKLWPLQQEVPADAVRAALPLDALVAAGVLGADGERVRAMIDIRPYGSEDLDEPLAGWVVSDLTPGLDQVVTRTRPDYVLGVSPASTSLAQMTMRTPVDSALDLGTGCGVQSLHLSRHSRRVVATDINPRALQHARLTAALNRTTVDMRDGSLFEPVAGERFDLIVTNPPYVMSPPVKEGERLVYREGGFTGDGLVRAVVTGAPDHLTEGGSLQVLGNWAVVDGEPWQERVAGWAAGTGCDLWVVERERLDVYDYIEVWLTDAGLAGSPEWVPRYRAWLDYFRGLGISEVGMGWITLTRAGRQVPDVQVESWPHAIAQPVGGAIAQHRAAVTHSLLPDDQLLAGTWRLAPFVDQETLGDPGAADPRHIVLRQATGLRRAVEADTVLAGVLGACDGDLPLGAITSAIAQLLEVDADAVVAQVLPEVRRALRDGMLLAS